MSDVSDRIRVGLPAGSAPGSTGYPVVVGSGVLGGLGAALADALDGRPAARVAVVTSAAVGSRHGDRLRRALGSGVLGPRAVGSPVVGSPVMGKDVEVHEIVVDDGEPAKNLATLAEVYRGFAAIPLGRDDVVVAFGGGVIGDLVGFAAATWNRGVRLVHVPTTLLAQVDASIGGKTGVNVPEGKNLVGAFHQPVLVVCDVALLRTLPRRELLAGLGEVAKYGFIADPAVLDLLDEHPVAVTDGDPEILADLVRRSVRVKADVVGSDEREAGRRMILNYGHTVGHAIEALTGYTRYRHGEAVALGMVAAASVGESMQISRPGLTEMTVGVLSRLGLPTGGVRLDTDAVWRTIALDKKTRAGSLRMVLCSEPGHVEVVADPPREAIDDALARIA